MRTNFAAIEIEQVIFIHHRIAAIEGKIGGAKNLPLLHSTLETCKARFGGEELYFSLFDKAATLFHSLVTNQVFLAENLKTAYAVTLRFLNSNGYVITASQEEIIQFCKKVSQHKLKVTEITEWLEKYCQART